jgi:beta-galactosidase
MIRRLPFALAAVALGLLCASLSSAPPGAKRLQSAWLAPRSSRFVVLLDKGWMFHPMPGFDLWAPEAVVSADQIKMLHCPAPGNGWRPVQLPDDYVVKGDFSREPNPALLVDGAQCLPGGRECRTHTSGSALASAHRLAKMKHPPRHGRSAYGGHGYLPLYPAWYRRTFFIPASAKDKSVWLNFGGVYRDAVVFVNGRFMEQHPSGYTAFRLNITSAVHYGEQNSVSVFVDPRWLEGWFYEGGGIYRHVRLMITDKLQVAPWGTFVISKVPGPIHYGSPAGDQAAANLTLQTTVRNDHRTAQSFTLVSQVIDPSGKIVASLSSGERLSAGQQLTFRQHVALRDALLWSLHHCNLYRLATAVRAGGSVIDNKLTTFGIRTLRFDPDRGFFLDGKHVEIRGTCNHQDFPGMGIAAPDNLWFWRVAKLKAMGANAYRCSHNPVSEAFYRACDRMGMLVMDENRHLGDTYFPKSAMGTPYSNLSDLKAMVLEHRNHPSIIMWSMCNEEGLERTPYGARMFAAMKEAVKKIDPTRPTTSAMNGGYTKDGFISVEGVLGMNYHNSKFAQIHGEYPHLMIFGSEDVNSYSSRGTFKSCRATALCSEYGFGYGPGKSATKGFFLGHEPWLSWGPVMGNPFVAGEFVWTGFDYRGEPNPFSWPAVTSQTGSMDLCGFPKPAYFYWKAWWRRKPSVYIFPNWNFPKTMVGKSVPVRSYSNCDRVELLLNGKSLGTKDMPRYRYLEWNVPYTPGVLNARGYDQGRLVAQYTVRTAGPPVALELTAEVHHLPANGEDIAPIRVAVVDARGRVAPDADNLIRFSVSGPGTLAGVANGNPASHEANAANQRKAFRGLCMVMVRASDHPGALTVNAQAAGLKPARIVIHTVPARRGNQMGQ